MTDTSKMTFERKLQQVPYETRCAIIDVADTCDMAARWFGEAGVQFEAADLLRFASMVLLREERVARREKAR